MEIIDSSSTQHNIIPTANPAGFLLRFVAYFIDRLIVGFISLAVIFPILAIMGISLFGLSELDTFRNFENLEDNEKVALVMAAIAAYSILIIIAVSINWLYYSLFESSERQATPGKMAVGIKVTSTNGQRISFLNATGRFFGKIISGMLFGFGYIMILFTEKKQGLHDLMAGTLVVKK